LSQEFSRGSSSIVAGDDDGIETAAVALACGELVAFPTETVYGLGANAENDEAVAAVYAAKGRPSFNPLIVHLPDARSVEQVVAVTPMARMLAERFWPGALTLVLPRGENCKLSLLVSAGLDTAAVRVPDHPVAQSLMLRAGCPVAAPSANRSGAISPTTADHVIQSLPTPADGGPNYVVDGGPCPIGLESTVVDLSGSTPALLRPGGIATEDIETVTGPLAAATNGEAPKSPGMLDKHYAPRAPLRLDATSVDAGEALLGFGPETGNATLNLSAAGDLNQAAANLFAMLRELDGGAYQGIAVMKIPDHGLGQAINDRLRRAAQSS